MPIISLLIVIVLMWLLLQYFLKMSSTRAQPLPTLLANDSDWEARLPLFLVQIKTYNIQSTFSMVEEISRTLRGQAEPIRKAQALQALSQSLLEPNYPLLLFVQLHILPVLTPAIEFAGGNRELSQLMGYFERSGYSSATQHIHNISYNFIVLALRLLSACATIKPYRVYEGREYEEPSLFLKASLKHLGGGLEDIISPKEDYSHQRQKYLQSLSQWTEFEFSLVIFFTDLLESYLASFVPVPQRQTPTLLVEALHYGETLISSEIIARLVEIMANHHTFSIRIQALRLLDRMVLWGDVEALLALNFTDHLEQIVKAVCEVKGDLSLDEGRFFCPDIPLQNRQKQEFYQIFLTCLQNWAITYPNQEYLIYKGGEDVLSQPSPVAQFYRLLRERKNTIFPQNLGVTRYQKDSKAAFHEKYLRNQLILKQIYEEHLSSSDLSIKFPRGISELRDYYQKHKETLIAMLAEQSNTHQSMERLQEFREHFEGMVECLSVGETPTSQLDQVIENGLELIEIVDLLQLPFHQLLVRQLDEKKFREKATSICVRFFSPRNESSLLQFYSERVVQMRENLVQLLRRQRSSPLEKELKGITSSAIVKQFRQRYKHKQERQSSSRNSESSELNLEIYTKTKFTKESREQMDKSNDLSFKNKPGKTGPIVSPVKEGQVVVGGEEKLRIISRQNSLNISRENKKLTLASKQIGQPTRVVVKERTGPLQALIEEPKREVEVTSQTKTSRQILKQQTPPHRRGTKIQQKERTPLVSLSENSQYFTFMPSEVYKCSYTHPRILIFRSPFLSIERVVHRASGASSKMKIDIVFFAHQPLRNVEYTIEEQECIKIESVGSKLPSCVNLNSVLVLQFVGEMRKIPLRLPTFALFINKALVFEYILPFTINFFLLPKDQKMEPPKPEDLNMLLTPRLVLSNHLFPERNLFNLRIFLPGCHELSPNPLSQVFIWSSSFCSKAHFHIFFQYNSQTNILIIRGSLAPQACQFHSLLRYIIGFFAHLYAEREA